MNIDIARRAGLGVIALAALVVVVAMAPPTPETPAFNLTLSDYQRLLDQTLDDFEANNRRADSAPQQQVVNGWVARDLLTVIALQNTELLKGVGALGDQNSTASSALAVRDERPPLLLALAVLAICWLGIAQPRNQPAAAAGSGDSKPVDSGTVTGELAAAGDL